MHVGDLSAGISKLRLSFEALQLAWLEVRDQWQDHNAKTLQENYLDPLGPRVKMALEAMGHLSMVLGTAQRACDPDADRML